MDFYTYTTTRDACKRSGAIEDPDEFYRAAFEGAVQMDSAQFYGQLHVEREWEQAKKPYYSAWPSIVPMLTRPSSIERRPESCLSVSEPPRVRRATTYGTARMAA